MIINVWQRISVCDFRKVWCMCNKESMFMECRDVARWDCMLSSACSVGIVSSYSWWESCCEIIGIFWQEICGVLSSVWIDPRSVGYICKSSVDTWQADVLNGSPAFTSTCVRGGLASFPGQRNISCRSVGKWYIQTFLCHIIVDCWWLKSKFRLHSCWRFGLWKNKLAAQVSHCVLNIAESNRHTVMLLVTHLL